MLSKKHFFAIGLLLIAGFLFFNAGSAAAADKFWTGASSTSSLDFWEPENWDTAVPAENDDIWLFATTTKTAVVSTPVDLGTGKIYVGYNRKGDSGDNSAGSFYLLIKEGASLTNRNLFEVGTSSTIWLTSGSLTVGTTTMKQLASTTISSLTGATSTVTVTGNWTMDAGATYSSPTNSTTTINGTTQANTFYSTSTPTFGYLVFGGTGGGTTNLQTNASVANRLNITAERTLDAEGATVTLSGSNSNSATWPLEISGTFTSATSTVTYSGTGATTVASTTYATVNWNGATTYTLGGNATVGTAGTVASGATLAISTYTLTATGSTWDNNGTITAGTGGKIVLAAVLIMSDSAGGSAVSSFGDADTRPSVHLEVTDTSLNFNASTAETQTVSITASSIITDAEGVVLTETGVGTGIFQGSITFQLSGTNVSGVLDYQGPGTLSVSYTDSQDSSDTESASGAFTGTAPGGGGSSSSSSGGTTSSSQTTITTTTTTTTTETGALTESTSSSTETATASLAAEVTTSTGPTLESVQSKIADAVSAIAALSASPSASELTNIQAQIAAILVDIQSLQGTVQASSGASLGLSFATPLSFGARNAGVTDLQNALKTDAAVYPEGLVTGYFGLMTQKAVQKFQEKYGIASQGDSGYGYVGPKTRAKLNELFK